MSSDQVRSSVAVWFEIPAAELARAVDFYQTIFETTLRQEEIAAGVSLAVFPYEAPGISGAVIKGEGYRPGTEGTVVYLNCNGRLDAVLRRIEAAGGQVVTPPTALPRGMGTFAHFIDTEGNRVGLHAVE